MEKDISISVLIAGLVIVISTLIKFGFRKISLPAITGYFLLGFLLRLSDGIPFIFLILSGLTAIFAPLLRGWSHKEENLNGGDINDCLVFE